MALVVFTGGARSGKSGAAQRLAARRALDTGAEVVVAVFGRGEADDPEFAERIAHHQGARPPHWGTLEAADARSWTGQVPNGALLVLDCLGTLLGRAMEEAFEATGGGVLADAAADSLPAGFASAALERFSAVVDWVVSRQGDIIVVTNETGDGIVPGYASGRFFRDELGRANRGLVDAADAAYLCVAGRAIALSTLPRDAKWPTD